ncbi:MAG: hypothetical protein JKY14_13715 [Paraglaciecola sp.]|nr:hypothetical protein [Paraglaciecola sp.]
MNSSEENKAYLDGIMADQVKRRNSSDIEFFTSTKGWSDDIVSSQGSDAGKQAQLDHNMEISKMLDSIPTAPAGCDTNDNYLRSLKGKK